MAALVILGGLLIGTSSGQTGKTDQPGKTDNKDDPKKDQPKKDDPKAAVKDQPKKDEPKAAVKDQPKKDEPKKKEEPKAAAKDQPKTPGSMDKTVKFAMDGKAWKTVFSWLVDETGKPVISVYIPTGSLTFVGPANKSYTIPEVIDIINEGLLSNSQTQKFYLINRERSFTLIPADEKLDPILLPRVQPNELEKHGNTELAQMILPLKSLVAEDVAAGIKKMMGPFGEVVPMTQTGVNQLILMDNVGNLKLIRTMIENIEKDIDSGNDSITKALVWIRVREAERILKDVLGDPATQPSAAAGTPGGAAAQGGPGGRGQGRGGPGAQPGIPGANPLVPGGVAGPGVRGATDAVARVVRPHHISTDESTNTILVVGPPDKVSLAKKTLNDIDKPAPGQTTKVTNGAAIMRIYNIPNGNADAIAKTLQQSYQNANSVKITAAGSNSIIVYAFPDDQVEIGKQIVGSDERPQAALVDCGILDAPLIGDRLKEMFGDLKGGGLYVQADKDSNKIVLRGPPALVADAKAVILVMQGAGQGGLDNGNLRSFTFEKGGAAAMGQFIEKTLKSKGYEVQRYDPESLFINPSSNVPQDKMKPAELDRKNPLTPSEPKKDGGMEPAKKDGVDRSSRLFFDSETQRVAFREEQQQPQQPGTGVGGLYRNRTDEPQAQPQPQPQGQAKSGLKPLPVTITAFGNRIILSSKDKDDLDIAQVLILQFTRSSADGDFEVIRLRNGDATSAAQVLDEVFNGKAQPGGRGAGGGRGRGGAVDLTQINIGAQPQQVAQRTEVIRVVADTTTNSLLVRASPLDMLRIKRLLGTIDSGENDKSDTIRNHTIKLHNTTAVEVAGVLRDVYREQTNANSQGGGGGGRGGQGGGQTTPGITGFGFERRPPDDSLDDWDRRPLQ